VSHPALAEIRRSVLEAGADRSIRTPPGRVAVSRERVLAELGISADDSAAIDEALEEIGGDLLTLERPRSMPLTLGRRASLEPARPPVLFFVVSDDFVD
jgi:hypothetical protein